jgi:hypothetical protein
MNMVSENSEQKENPPPNKYFPSKALPLLSYLSVRLIPGLLAYPTFRYEFRTRDLHHVAYRQPNGRHASSNDCIPRRTRMSILAVFR